MLFTSTFGQYNYNQIQHRMGQNLPATGMSGMVFLKVANNASMLVPYVYDGTGGGAGWLRANPITVYDTVDPTTYADADIQDGDTWENPSDGTHVFKYTRVAGAWFRPMEFFASATDPATQYTTALVQANDTWFDLTTPSTPAQKMRNAGNTAWVAA